MLNIMYCIEHEREVAVGPAGNHVVFGTYDCGCTDIGTADECYGPFTDTSPDELPEDWQDLLDEPSAEELTQMDANAEELLLSL